jgi:deoxyribose-phosphate aldolase
MTRDELQRLIDTIVSELMPTLARPPQGRCSCHAVLDDCCPDRLRGVLDAGASRVGMYAGGGAPVVVAAMIDHTLLKPDATRSDIERSAGSGTVPVCDRLREPDVGGAGGEAPPAAALACTVVGFPLGATTPDVRAETRRAIFDGAREIDMVINVGALSRATFAWSSATSKR